ncbi:hypothetical protein BDW72DRAFT_187686 [Aspergillus terricola var. indicus]
MLHLRLLFIASSSPLRLLFVSVEPHSPCIKRPMASAVIEPDAEVSLSPSKIIGDHLLRQTLSQNTCYSAVVDLP